MNSKMFRTTEFSARFNELKDFRDHRQLVYAMERMYGTGGFGNSLACCIAVEGACGVVVPERAQYIRTILMELSLMQENLLRLAAIAEHLGSDHLSMRCWTEREKVLEILDDLTGNRMILSMCRAGGVRRDLDKGILAESMDELEVILQKVSQIGESFEEDRRLVRQLRKVGVLPEEVAIASSATGPAAKGSGLAYDRRQLGEYGAYRTLKFKPLIEKEGDCHARCRLKIREVIQSGELVKLAVEGLPEGPIAREVPEQIDGEWIARVEQADGADTCFVRGCGSAFLEEVGIRRASEANGKVMYKLENWSPETNALIRLTLGLDSSLKER